MMQIDDQRHKAYDYDPIENPSEAYDELHRLFDLLTALEQDGIWEDHFRFGQASLAMRFFPEAITELKQAVALLRVDDRMGSTDLPVIEAYLAASHIAWARSNPTEPIHPESSEARSYATLRDIDIEKDRRYQILFEVLSIAGVGQKWTDWHYWAREHLDDGDLEQSDSKYATAWETFPHDRLAVETARGYQFVHAARLGIRPTDDVADLYGEGERLLLSAEKQGHRLSAEQHLVLALGDLEASRYRAAITRCDQAQCEQVDERLSAKLWLAKGHAQYGNEQKILAIRSWRKASDFTACPEAYEALLELGRHYFRAMEYDTATGFLRSAGARGAPYHLGSEAHLLQGLAYAHQGDIGQARACWREAERLASLAGDPQAFAKAIYYQFRASACKPQEAANLLNGTSDVPDASDAPEILAAHGELMYTQGDFNAAEILFTKALSRPSDLSPDVLVLLGSILRKQPDRIEEAALAFRSAAKQYAENSNEDLSQAFNELAEVLSGHGALPSIDSALRVAFRDPIGAAHAKKLVDDGNLELKNLLGRERTIDDPNKPDRLVVLRRFNSFSPALNTGDGNSKGGGYFAVIKQHGYVIDPGYNFLANFFSRKVPGGDVDVRFTLADIDAIILTHAHHDHTADLESIITLLYRYNHTSGKQPRRISLYAPLDVNARIASLLKDSARDLISYTPLELDRSYELKPGVTFTTMPCRHADAVTGGHALGLALKHDAGRLLISGDTGWDESVAERYSTLRDGCSVLIAHVGSLTREEQKYMQESGRIPDTTYAKHLGLLGVAHIIGAVRPKLAVLSEFGEELRYTRLQLAEALGLGFGITCFAGDIGLTVSLDGEQALCTKCDHWVRRDDICCIPTESFEICYMCRNCAQKGLRP